MDALFDEHERLSNNANLSKSVTDVQKTIDFLVKARSAISASTSKMWDTVIEAVFVTHIIYLADRSCLPDPNSASVTLAKLQNPVKQSFDIINNDLKEVYKGLGNYSKALDKVTSPASSILFSWT